MLFLPLIIARWHGSRLYSDIYITAKIYIYYPLFTHKRRLMIKCLIYVYYITPKRYAIFKISPALYAMMRARVMRRQHDTLHRSIKEEAISLHAMTLIAATALPPLQ